jgi:hypothetical protein
MKLLLSNIPPLKNNTEDFTDLFDKLIYDAKNLRIACGYISTESLVELKKIIEINKGPNLELIIGMHKFDGFTKMQHDAAIYLHNYLKSEKYGAVFLSTAVKYHGKLYNFLSKNNEKSYIIGSSNLDATQRGHYNFETDIYDNNPTMSENASNFFEELKTKACIEIDLCKDIKIVSRNPLLEKHYAVTKINEGERNEIDNVKSDVIIEIPIKGDETPLSNLNAYFGKGRIDSRGLIKPRHWYEVELIVPSKILAQEGYPKEDTIITVLTDDEWKFNCKRSGDNGKNLRSDNDLRILGKWMKGRLENAGCLNVGEPVTDEVLNKYGRNTLTLKKLNSKDTWFFDFGVKNASKKLS